MSRRPRRYSAALVRLRNRLAETGTEATPAQVMDAADEYAMSLNRSGALPPEGRESWDATAVIQDANETEETRWQVARWINR